MNTQCFRHIFNTARGCLMAVAESALGQGKSSGQTRAGMAGHRGLAPIQTALRPAVYALLCLLGSFAGVAIISTPAHAQIVANRAAPSIQQATVLNAANGVPLVNIQTPSAAGVSHNTYSQFDVDPRGAILNNARNNASTQLGGWVQGNPWLAGGTARIILNEVNSNSPSLLQGYVEVAGDRAQVVIANPVGISCDGCGFINANRVTLTTGTPTFSGGNLDGYRVQGGTITVSGAGLDASRADYTDLIARAIQVNAGIWAQNLRVTSGANQVGVDTLQVTPLAGAGAAPAFAIDVAQLGGMYAGKISLVGTEAGVGVRNAGQIGASAGEISITVDGQLYNSGLISSSDRTQINATAGIANSGSLFGGIDLNLETAGDIVNSGIAAAQRNTTLTATGASSRITSTAAAIVGAGIQSDGSLGSAGDLNLVATRDLGLYGQNLAGGDQMLSAQTIDLSGNTTRGRNLDIRASQGDADFSHASIRASDNLSVNASNIWRTDFAQVVAGQINLTAHDLSNLQGTLLQMGAGTLNLTLLGTLDNTQGRIAANSHDLSLAATTLLNTNGSLEHAGGGALTITARTLDSTRGSIASNGLLDLTAGSATLDSGTTSAQQIHITSPTLSNRGGQIVQTGTMGTPAATLIAITQLDNTLGLIASNSDLTLTTGDLINHGGIIQAQGTTPVTLTIAASGQIDNSQSGSTAGLIGTDGALHFSAASLNNTGSHLSAGTTLDANVTAEIANVGGTIASAQQINLSADSIDNRYGTLGSVAAAAQLIARSGRFNNQHGHVEAATMLNVDAIGIDNSDGVVTGAGVALDSHGQTFDNTRGTVAARGALSINSATFNNSNGLVQAQTSLNIDTHGYTLTNANTLASGGLLSQGTLTLNSGDLDNSAGNIASRGNLSANAATLINTLAGRIRSEADLTLIGTALNNLGGQVQANHDLSITVAGGTADNRGGLLSAGNTLSVAADTFNNATTQGANQGAEATFINVQAAHLNNAQGSLRADDTASFVLSGNLDNTQGSISSLQHIVLRDPLAISSPASKTLAITNTNGTLIAGQSLDIHSASLSGDGNLLSLGDLNIKLLSNYTQTGLLQADGNATLEAAGTLTNQSTLQAGASLKLTAATIDNQASGQLLGTDLDLTATASHTFTNRGLINGSNTFIDAITLDNLGTGRIYGDHVALSATTLNNLAEGGSAPVIAARTRLDLGVTDLTNTEHALIYSVGDLAIGGALDGNHHATGQANSLTNSSATIEAGGNLDLAATTLINSNAHFATADILVSTLPVEEYQLVGSVNRWLPNQVAVTPDPGQSTVTLFAPDGANSNFYRYVYTRRIIETQVTQSDPGQILAGGRFSLTAGSVLNDNSRIVAGGTLNGSVGSLTNTSVSGQRITNDNGTLYAYYYVHHHGDPRTEGISAYAYTPADQIDTLTLSPTVYAGNTVPGGSGASIGNLSLGNVSQSTRGSNASGVSIGASHGVTSIAQVTALGAALGGNGGGNIAPVVRSGGINTTVPNNALFHSTPAPDAHYLIETDPSFANYRNWLSSDYLLTALSIDPAATQKRLGDGFYEQRLVKEQVLQLTGQRFLSGYADDEAQYRALLNHGVTVAQAWHLIPGVALSAAQMAQLTSDIVWLVEQTITLADGTTTRALVPQLYVRTQPGDLAPSGALIAANTVDLHIDQTLLNQGSIAGRTLVRLDANNIANLGGRIQGQTVALSALTDLSNRGGQIRADDTLLLNAGRDLTVASTTLDTHSTQGTHTGIDRVVGLYVSNPAGLLLANAGRDLNLTAAQLENLGAGSQTQLTAGRDLNLGTVRSADQIAIAFGGSANHHNQSHAQDNGSTLTTSGDLTLAAGRDLNATAATLTSQQGALNLNAGHDLTLTSGQAEDHVDDAHQHNESGVLSRTTRSSRDTLDQTHAVGSALSGATVTLNAGQDLLIHGSSAVSDSATTVSAGRNLTLESATETRDERHQQSVSTSGLFSSGGIGITLGTQAQRTDSKDQGSTALASTVGSLGLNGDGNVSLSAGQHYTQTGSDILAPAGDITIQAQDILINEARETRRSQTKTEFEQSGLTLALTSPVISAVQTLQQQSRAASNTRDSRMHVLAAANAGFAAKNAYDAIQAGQGSTIGDKDNQIQTGVDADGKAITRDATAVDQAGGISLSLSLGSSQSSSTTTQTSDRAAGSHLSAGRDVTLIASGAGNDSDLTLQGTQVSAGRNATLSAEHDIKLLAAKNTASLSSNNQGSSASVGVSFGSQTGVTLSASGSQGKASGNDITYSNTHLTAGQQISLTSGNDTTLKGAVAGAPQIVANVGHDLSVESLQDSSTYHSKQSSLGGSVTIGPAPSGSLSVSASKINSDYLSVTEQSGLKAGDQGFQVNVQGNTTLTGGAITSTQTAVDQNKNTFHTGGTLALTDLQNKAEYTGEAIGVTLGSGISLDGKLAPMGSGAGIGSDSNSASSTTQSAISGIAGNKAARTGDKETGLTNTFDASKVQSDIEAQVQITQTFGREAPKAVANYAEAQSKALTGQAKAADQAGDTATRDALIADAKKWEEGGAYRIALHAVIGGLAGGTEGALGAGATATAAPLLNDLQGNVTAALKAAGASDTVANLAGQAVSTATAAGLGSIASGGSAAGATTGVNGDLNNRQLHPSETARIKQLAKGDPQKEARLTAAACALVHCADGVPKDDPSYAYLKAMQDAGQGMTEEIALLAQQKGQIGKSVNAPLFTYNTWGNGLEDLASQNKVGTRLGGLAQATGGVLTAVAGAGLTATGGAACPETLGAGCGVAAAGLSTLYVGADNASAGATTVVTGNSTLTTGEKVLQSLGLSPQAAALTYATLGLTPTAVEAVALNRVVNVQTAANAWAKGTYTGESSITYEGRVYRFSDPKYAGKTWDIYPGNIAENYRYSGPGVGSVYSGTSVETSATEVFSYIKPSEPFRPKILVAGDVRIDGVLDLTDPAAMKALGVTRSEIIQSSHGANGAYLQTQRIAQWAREQGYNGILAPSAQNPSGTNLITFDNTQVANVKMSPIPAPTTPKGWR